MIESAAILAGLAALVALVAGFGWVLHSLNRRITRLEDWRRGPRPALPAPRQQQEMASRSRPGAPQ